MLAAYYRRTGPAHEVLELGELDAPEPGPGEVRVRLRTSGVNPSDVKNRRGGPDRPMAFDLIVPHSDGAGEIDSLGAGVDNRRLGERVWVWNAQFQRPFGTAAQFVVLPAEQAAALPEGVDFEVGACLGIPAMTAWRAATLEGRLDGRWVLVAGGAGAVGHYAIQIARLQGARVIATVSSAEKAARAEQAGAEIVIDYKREDVAERIMAATDERGVDRVIEVDLAGNAALLPRIVRQGATVVCYGANAPEATLPFQAYLRQDIALRFFLVYRLPPDVRRAAIAGLMELLKQDRLIHAIDRTYPLAEIAAAHERVETGQAIGNVVLEIP